MCPNQTERSTKIKLEICDAENESRKKPNQSVLFFALPLNESHMEFPNFIGIDFMRLKYSTCIWERSKWQHEEKEEKRKKTTKQMMEKTLLLN